MQFDARLGGEAAALARDHAEVLRRLPATVHAFILVEMKKWPTLFPALAIASVVIATNLVADSIEAVLAA